MKGDISKQKFSPHPAEIAVKQ